MKKSLLIALSAVMGMALAAKATLTEYKNGEVHCIQVENSFYKVVITPQIGGKILKFFDKISQTELVRVAKFPTTPGQPIGHVGMLDDRSDFVMANFTPSINTANPGRISVTLTAISPSTQVRIRKKLTFFDNSPVINVRYRYENHSKTNITGFALGIRNLFYPSGDGVSAEDRYYFPTTHTMRRLIGYSLKDETGEAMPDMAAKLDTQLGAPYHGLLNLKKRSGLVFSFEDDYYAGYHIWKGGIKYPTYEWTYRFLPAGHRHDTEFNIIQVNDMGSIAFASPEVLADVQLKKSAKKQIDVSTTLKYLQQPPAKSKLIISCRAINWKWNAKDKVFAIRDIVPLKNSTYQTAFNVPADGLYVIEQKLVLGRRVLAEWREAVTFGKYSTLPVFQIKYRKTTESAAIAGWEAPQPPKMHITPADKARGFAVFNELGKEGFTQAKKLSILLGSNEFETVELVAASLGYNGNIQLSVDNPANFPVNARFRKVYTLKGSGARPTLVNILDRNKNVELEELQPIFLTVGDRNGVKPGVYNFTVNITAGGNKKVAVPVEVKVLDITLPHRNAVNLEAEGYPMLFPGVEKSVKTLNGWYKNMRDHGIDFFQFVGRMRGKPIAISYLDYFIDNALQSGLIIFKAARYDISKPTAAEKANWAGLGKYLRSKGYQDKDIFIKILDEQPIEKYKMMGETGKWLKAAGFRPFSTFSNMFYKADALRRLNGNFEMFQGGYTTRADYLARLKDGLLRPTDLYCHYTGTGTVTKSYEHMLYWGLQTAALEHPLFHNHEYMRGGNRKVSSNIVRIDDDNLPEDSPAFEALRDGMDVANFAALYRRYLKQLPSDSPKKVLFESRFARLFGRKDSVFKIHQIPVMGVINDRLVPMTTEQYRAGRAELLLLLADMKAELGNRTRLSSLIWNDLTIAAPHIGYNTIAATADEKAAAAYFKGLIDSAITCGKPGKGSVTVTFKIAPVESSYTISKDGSKITITAADLRNLKLAASNWFNTFDVK